MRTLSITAASSYLLFFTSTPASKGQMISEKNATELSDGTTLSTARLWFALERKYADADVVTQSYTLLKFSAGSPISRLLMDSAIVVQQLFGKSLVQRWSARP